MAWIFSEDGNRAFNLDCARQIDIEFIAEINQYQIQISGDNAYYVLGAFDHEAAAVEYLQYAMENAVKT